jgi:hypothetical protein
MEHLFENKIDNNSIPEPEAKDRILRFLVDAMPRENIIAEEIHENVFPNQPKVLTYQLLIHITNANENLVLTQGRDWSLTYFTVWFTATELTRHFLDQGGFTKIHHDKLLEERENEIRKQLEIKSIQDGLKTNLATRWNYRINTVISIAALLISLIAIAISLKWL